MLLRSPFARVTGDGDAWSNCQICLINAGPPSGGLLVLTGFDEDSEL